MIEKTLLVLGAGIYQVPGIRAAAARGLRVITADWDLDNPGHRYAALSHCVSTTDSDGVLALAREEQIDGVVTFASDVATETVARVAEALALPGIAPETVRSLSNKGQLRALQRDHALSYPDFCVSDDPVELESAARNIGSPLVVKPVDSSGSRGVKRIDSSRVDEIRSAISEAMSFSRTGHVCVEAFLAGCEVGGDGIVVDGELVYAQCTRKHLRDFVVTGHSLPPEISREDRDRVTEAVGALCKAAGLKNAVVNFDVIVAPDRVTVVELSPRTGGNGIPAVLKAVTGVDTVEAAIALALGKKPKHLTSMAGSSASAGSCVLGLVTDGRLERIPTEKQVREELPELVEFAFNAPADKRLSAWTHAGASIGYCVFRIPDGVSYDEMATRARALCGMPDGSP